MQKVHINMLIKIIFTPGSYGRHKKELFWIMLINALDGGNCFYENL